MPKYCANCLKLFENASTCPECRRAPRLTDPAANDPVLLDKVDYMKAEMLKPLLSDAGIPATFKGGIADAFGMNVGLRLDVIRVLVPYQALSEAQNLLEVLNGSYTEDATVQEEENQ